MSPTAFSSAPTRWSGRSGSSVAGATTARRERGRRSVEAPLPGLELSAPRRFTWTAMRDLPTGTVTFLFTDIEGSTRLLDELGEGYAEVLAEHHRVVRKAIEEHGGVEVDTQGD